MFKDGSCVYHADGDRDNNSFDNIKLGELKSMATKLRGIDTKEGIVKDRYSDVTIEYVAYMNLFDRDTKVKELEEQIETLQEEIEAYNALTMI
jgi:archaellum component FlaC